MARGGRQRARLSAKETRVHKCVCGVGAGAKYFGNISGAKYVGRDRTARVATETRVQSRTVFVHLSVRLHPARHCWQAQQTLTQQR